MTDQRADLDDVLVLEELFRRYSDPTTWAIDGADESWALVCADGHVTVTDDTERLGDDHCRHEDEHEDTGRAYRCGLSLGELVVVDTDAQIIRPVR